VFDHRSADHRSGNQRSGTGFDAFSPLAPYARHRRAVVEPRTVRVGPSARRVARGLFVLLVFLTGVRAFDLVAERDGVHLGLARSPAAFDAETAGLEVTIHHASDRSVAMVDERAVRAWLERSADRWEPRPLPPLLVPLFSSL